MHRPVVLVLVALMVVFSYTVHAKMPRTVVRKKQQETSWIWKWDKNELLDCSTKDEQNPKAMNLSQRIVSSWIRAKMYDPDQRCYDRNTLMHVGRLVHRDAKHLSPTDTSNLFYENWEYIKAILNANHAGNVRDADYKYFGCLVSQWLKWFYAEGVNGRRIAHLHDIVSASLGESSTYEAGAVMEEAFCVIQKMPGRNAQIVWTKRAKYGHGRLLGDPSDVCGGQRGAVFDDEIGLDQEDGILDLSGRWE